MAVRFELMDRLRFGITSLFAPVSLLELNPSPFHSATIHVLLIRGLDGNKAKIVQGNAQRVWRPNVMEGSKYILEIIANLQLLCAYTVCVSYL